MISRRSSTKWKVISFSLNIQEIPNIVNSHVPYVAVSGVLSVKPDMARGTVAIKGAVDLLRLVEYIKKRTGKHAEIVKEEGKKDMKGEEKKKGEVKEEAENGKKGEASEDGVHLIYWVHCPSQCPQCYMNRLCCCCCENAFSDENVHSCSVM